MATGTIPTPPPLPASAPVPPPLPESVERRLIDEQLDRTRMQVKLVDLLFGLLAIAVGSLAILLAAAVADHWIVGLSVGARLAVFTLLVGWCGFCAWRWLAPSVTLRINPLYAASAIERYQPSLKNSLINYLLVRSRPEEAAVVRDALERRAAADIAVAPVDAAVDRTHVLRLGYALVAVVLALAVYKVASPKDPFQTLARVLAPLADIARPSRVVIRDVSPGDAEVFHGRQLTISAIIEGLRSGESPELLYTTNDGQVVDAVVPMTASEDGLRWQADLPPDPSGAQHDFRYHLRAGDAISDAYEVLVSPAPSITVRSLHYEYPRYTRRQPQTIDDRGDISALEGTRVTVRAEANQPIHSAWIEVDPLAGGGLLEGQAKNDSSSLQRVTMKAEDRTASGSFQLKWDAEAGAPRHRSYRVRFATAEGNRNERPIVYEIDVQPDLPPEVEVLEPRQDRVEVPEDGSLEIVVRAIDPDYGVSLLELNAVAGGTKLEIPALLSDRAGQTGQIVVKHNFAPRDHGLKAGDQVVYWARVADNRAAPGQDTPEPNSARTQNRHLVITRPEKSTGGGSAGENGDDESSLSGEKSEGEGEKSEGEKGGEGSSGEKKKESAESGGEESGGEQGGSEGQSQQGDSGDSQQSGAKENSGGSAGGQSGSQQESEGSQGSQGSPTPGASSGQPQENGSSEGESSGAENSSNQKPNTNGAPGAKQDGTAKPPSQNGGNDQGEPAGEGGQGEQPLSPDGTQDREVFERLQEYLQKKQEGEGQPAGEGADKKQPSGNASGASPQSNPPEGDTSGQGAAKTPQPGESPQGAGQRDQATPSQAPDQKHGEAEGENSGAGQGGSPKGPAETKKEQANPQKQPGEKQPAPGQGDNGNSGAGARPEEPRGSPESQEANRDRQKNSEGSNQESRDEGASSPSTSKRQSDSQGGQGGDRSGGGNQGGGQSAKQPGNDSAGSSSAADEGAGAASEPGAGETSNKPGSQQLSETPTGNPSQNTPGQGSGVQQTPQGGSPQSTPSQQSSQPGANQPTPPNPGASPSPTSAPSGNREGPGQHTFGPQPQGGAPDQLQPQNQTPPPPVPENAQVNLEYARKATDLALETLRDQKSKPDDELLERLGWTAEDLQRFLARWEAMKQAAAQEGPTGDEARQTLSETLESLGLRPTNSGLRRGQTDSDDQRALRDSGHRTAPPPEYQKLFEAYLKGAGRRTNNEPPVRGKPE